MAKYDRRFLVPYLQDVVSVELLLGRLRNEKEATQRRILNNKSFIDRHVKPQKPEVPKGYAMKNYVISVCFFCVFFLTLPFLGIFSAVFLVFGFLFKSKGREDAEEEQKYEKDKREYDYKIKIYEDNQTKYIRAKSTLEQDRIYLDTLSQRIEKVSKLREMAYSVNIIPHQYRNVYAAHYLYDFFRGGQEDDLEKVIGIFVLEEIKARLDKIIEQQTEMILNQRVMIANQERMDKHIAENHEREMRQYARLNQNAQRQTQYLEMINTNLEISNYFAYNEYIRRR